MLVANAELWFAATNTYVVARESGGPGVIIDAPPDVAGISELVKRHDVIPTALLVTHGHVDHCGASGGVAAGLGIAAYIHPDDEFLSSNPTLQAERLMGVLPPGDYEPAQYVDLVAGQTLELADITFEVRHTPGHTPGHCCFYIDAEGLLFSGDQLFAGSIGRTDLPGGSYDQLMESMKREVLSLDDEVNVLPGHGPATTLGRERRSNPFLQGL